MKELYRKERTSKNNAVQNLVGNFQIISNQKVI